MNKAEKGNYQADPLDIGWLEPLRRVQWPELLDVKYGNRRNLWRIPSDEHITSTSGSEDCFVRFPGSEHRC